MIRELDIPPLWLALALAVVWAMGQGLGGVAWPAVGLGLIVLGLAVVVGAAAQMALLRTSFVPRRDPTALVTGGFFAYSRNPIYLGAVLVLLGAVIYWGAWVALPVVPLFIWWITLRYILDEEARLRAGFGFAFEHWAQRVPRWIWRL